MVAGCVAVIVAAAGTCLALALQHADGTHADGPPATAAHGVADWQFAHPVPSDGCATSKVFDPSASTPPADLTRQRATVAALAGASGPGWRVAYIRPTALGVVALVRGDVAAARVALSSRGVWQVARLAAGGSDAEDHDSQVEDVVRDRLSPLADGMDRLSQRSGFTSLALWTDQGAVLLTWKAPVPAAIQHLAMRSGPGSVIVDPARYSEAELHAAQLRLVASRSRITPLITEIAPCADGSGLQVDVGPGTPSSEQRTLARRVTRMVDVPVTVGVAAQASASARTTHRP